MFNFHRYILITARSQRITDEDDDNITQQKFLVQRQQNLDIDECFCRMGYVAIRENDEVVCRTLLTDLSCRVDSDCVHVDFSVCHPGAGKCICPGNTIYVTHLHACRNKLFHQNHDACNICGPNHVCHEVLERDLGRMNDVNANIIKLGNTLNTTNKLAYIGCSCELERFITSKKVSISAKTQTITNLCSLSLLYQIFLNYFECFPVLHKLQSTVQISNKIGNNECEACQKVNGKCYDQNNDGIADGCQCLPDRSFVLKSDKHENSRNKVKSMSLFRYKNERFSCETEHTIISIEMCATASLKHSESLNSNTSIHLLLRQAFYRFKCDVKHERTVASYHNDTIFVRDLSRGNQSTIIPQQNVVYYICLTPSLSESITYNLGKNLLQNWCHLSRERTGLISVNHLSIARLTVRNPISPHQCRFPYE
ncbi:unnamed protein product [Heterobilharzia americana]|nr:unnamed protein product [Heterobilharzia americana]